MSQADPFLLIAKGFPYKKALQFNTHDRAALTLALLETVQTRVNDGESPDDYGSDAAQHFIFLERDFGLGYAAAYWESIRKISKVRLQESFFKAPGVQGLLKKVILDQNNYDAD